MKFVIEDAGVSFTCRLEARTQGVAVVLVEKRRVVIAVRRQVAHGGARQHITPPG